jgi:capsid protein
VVLAQLTNGNLASSQAALDQTERVAAADQDTFIDQAVRPLDRSILREAHASGWLGDLPADLDRLTAGDYERPRRPDANRLRTRQAAELALQLGVSPTTVQAEMGYNFEDETRQAAADLAFAAAQGVTLRAAPSAPEPIDPDEPDDDHPQVSP